MTSFLPLPTSSRPDVPAPDVLGVIVRRAVEQPDAHAVIDEHGTTTYRELLDMAGAVTRALETSGVRPGDLVGTSLPRGRAAIAGILGVLGAGAGYVPLDPDLPTARLAGMVADTGVQRVLVATGAPTPALPEGVSLLPLPVGGPTAPLDVEHDPDLPAYVIFTSGSTGRPKGVVVPRRALAHFSAAAAERYEVTAKDRVLQFATPSFDASVEEIFVALTAGAAVVVRDEDAVGDPALLLRRCAERGVTVLDLPTAYWLELLAVLSHQDVRLPSGVRLVVIGGEAVSATAVRQWQDVAEPDVRLLNTYGPTETTVVATSADLSRWSGAGPVPIGTPLPGVGCRVLDPAGEEVAPGEPGELAVGGPTVAQGYLGHPELTARRFTHCPDGAREFRTGDRVVLGEDGQLVFLGRTDRQVKVRGFRVEPAEVESALLVQDGVEDAVVLVEERGGRSRLVAHLLDRTGCLDVTAVRAALGRSLPAHAVPSVLLPHDHFPRTPQGKNDRAALAEAFRRGAQEGAWPADGVALGDPGDTPSPGSREVLTSAVEGLWDSLLGREDGEGGGEDFFARGGDSLDAVRLLSAVGRRWGAVLALSAFYARPSVDAVVDAVLAGADHPAEDPSAVVSDRGLPEDAWTDGVVALSDMQRHFWISEQMADGRPVQTLGIRYGCARRTSPEILRAALDHLVARHPMLRAHVALHDDEPVLEVQPGATVPLAVLDRPGGTDRAVWAEEVRRRAVAEPFDLATAPLARVVLLRGAGDHEDELLLVVHHLVFDGWSVGVLGRELAVLTRALESDEDVTTALPVQPPHQVGPVRPEGAARDELVAYWAQRLDAVDLDLQLHADRPRPPSRTMTSARVVRPLPPELLDAWRRTGRQQRASLFMVVLAGLQVVLRRYTGATDVTVLATVAGRTEPGREGDVGALLTVIPVRGDVSGEPSFADLLKRVRTAVVSDLEHQELPLPEITRAAGLAGLEARNGLGPVVLAVHNTPATDDPDLHYIGDVAPSATVNHLCIGLDITEDGPVLTLDHAVELHDRERVEAMAEHLVTVLEAAASEPATAITRLALLTEVERERVLHTWNEDPTDGAAAISAPPGVTGVHQLLDAVAAAHPQAPALTAGGETLTYAALTTRANRLAHALRTRGVGPGSRVGICLDRGADLFVALWGVLKSGAAYVPLDPAYPVERLQHMLSDSRCELLLTRADLTGAPPAPAGTDVLALDAGADLVASMPAHAPAPLGSPTDAAYVMYTSGSTGRAKGVVIGHDNLVHAVGMWQRAYRLQPTWTYLQQASFSFDMFVCETFRALCTGGRLVVVPREVLLDPAALFTLMRKERVQSTELVPAVLRALLGHAESTGQRLEDLRMLVCGGEKWTVQEYRRAQALVGPGGRVVNAYGVTEATADSTYFDGHVEDLPAEAPLPIGRPFPGCRVYVLDAHRQPVPPGVVGELHLAGPGVGHGYVDRPELTAQKFVPDLFAPAPTSGATPVMYRSGDAARYRRDGTVEFLGRLDDQVKVNGHRVELGEVEAALGLVPGVADCAADVRTSGAGHAFLVGYLVVRAGADVTEAEVRTHVARTLPPHTVPSRVVVLPALPLSPNGKLDRRALPAPGRTGGEAPTAPRTATEQRVAGVWCAVLGRDEVGTDEAFFDAGGDSFSALRVARRLDPALSLVELYQQPTVRALAALLDARAGAAVPAGDGGRRPVLHRLTRADADLAAGGVTVVAVPFSGGSAVTYQPLADALPHPWALRAVELPGHDRSRPDEALESAAEVAERVLAELVAVEGPVLLYGHCLSVGITLEIARRAEDAGVDLVGVGLGAGFPTARPSGPLVDWWYRLAPSGRFTADRVYLEYLRGRGGFTDLEDPQEQAFMLRALRHDERDAEEWFTDAYRGTPAPRLRAPVLSVVGARDRVTDHHRERAAEWEHFATDVDQVVLAQAGHFFVRSHPAPLAEALVHLAGRAESAAATRSATTGTAGAVETHLDEGGARREGSTLAAGQPPTRRRREPRPSLAVFALLASGQFVSMIGSGLSSLVLSIWVLEQTGSITQFAVINAVGLLPGILAGPLGGAVADRFDRRRVMLLSDLAAGLAMTAVAASVLGTGRGPELWQIYAAVAVTSLAGAFQRPAFLAAVTQLVPKRYLGHTAGITQLGVSVGVVFAPLLGVGLYGVIGLGGVLLVDVGTFLVGVGTLLLVRLPHLLWQRREESFTAEIRNGWRYVVQRPGLRAALQFFVVDHAFYALGFAVIVPFLLTEFSPLLLGTALAAGGVGGLLGGLLMSVWGGTARRVPGMLVFMGLSSCGMVALGFAPFPAIAIGGMFLMTFGEVLAEGHWIAFVQRKVGFDLQGRVLSIFLTVMMLTVPLGYLLVGPLAEAYVQPMLEPGGALAGSVGAVLGTGPGRGLALLIVLSGLLQIAWVVRGWTTPVLRTMDDFMPDALPPAQVGDLNAMQQEADARHRVGAGGARRDRG